MQLLFGFHCLLNMKLFTKPRKEVLSGKVLLRSRQTVALSHKLIHKYVIFKEIIQKRSKIDSYDN